MNNLTYLEIEGLIVKSFSSGFGDGKQEEDK
jgi:hypothetical protein